MNIDPDRLRRAMRRPLDEATKADHLLEITDEINSAAGSRRGRRFTIKTALIATTLTAVLAGGAALAAEGSVPGDALYPIKQMTEDVRSVFDNDVAAEHRVEELDELVRRDRPAVEIDEQLVEAQVQVDRLPSDSPIRDDLVGLRHDIAATRDIPETDLPPKPDQKTVLSPADPTVDTKTTRPPAQTTAPKDTRPSVPPTTSPPTDQPPPTTQPPQDG